MKLILTIALVALGYTFVVAQDFNHYKTLLPSGNVPQDFTARSADKFATEVTAIEKDQSRKERRNRRNFYLESTFGIDDFLASGSVPFNDEKLWTKMKREKSKKPLDVNKIVVVNPLYKKNRYT